MIAYPIFAVCALFAADAAPNPSSITLEDQVRALQAATLTFADGGGYIRPPGRLPDLVWKEPAPFTKDLGPASFEVQWFADVSTSTQHAFRHTQNANDPGRYAAIIDAQTRDGRHVRRGLMMLCVPANWLSPGELLKNFVERLPLAEPLKKPWRESAEKIAAQKELSPKGFGTEQDALLLASLLRASRRMGSPTWEDNPALLNMDLQLGLRFKLDGRRMGGRVVAPKEQLVPPAPMLRSGSPAEAGIAPDSPTSLKALCAQWANETQEPFSVLAARHGVIFFYEACGGASLDSPTPLTSLTQLLTGTIFLRLVEQRLIEPDEPLGRILPDLPAFGKSSLTARQCLTHMSGLEGDDTWGGIYNPYLDNVIANGLEFLHPAQAFSPSGLGYCLLGRAMESASGYSALRLLHENLLEPIGMTHTSVGQLGSEAYSTTGDLGRLGQLLLNRGSYGPVKLFSPATFEKALPVDLNQFYPMVEGAWGLGLCWMSDTLEPENLSRHVIGHDTENGTLFRVDLEHDLVVIITRNQRGPNYDTYVQQFLKTIQNGLLAKSNS